MKYPVYAILLLQCLAFASSAQSSFIDSTFGNNGRFTYTFSTSTNFSRLNTTALLPDGKILSAGESGSGAAVVRCNANGTLDTSFGAGGEWISDDPDFVSAGNVIIQPDGKILLAGASYPTFKVVRLLPDGTYDPSFGQNGKSSFSVWFGSDLSIIVDMALQADGKIVLAGNSAINDAESMIARLNANGTLDATFGNAGKIKVKPNLFNADYLIGGRIGLNADNSILLDGFYVINGQPDAGFILRYKSNGQLDNTFGNNGIAQIPPNAVPGIILTLPSNDFLMLCYIYDTSSLHNTYTTLIKWSAAGKIDSTYADHGVAVFPTSIYSNGPVNGVLQPDGKVLAFGYWQVGYEYFIGRFNEDGSMDNTFGTNGIIIEENERFSDGFIQPDGKIVVVGPYGVGTPVETGSILRYLGSNSVGAIEASSPISSALLYPNPVAEQTLSLAYELHSASPVRIELLDLQGSILGTLLNAERAAGKQEETISLPEDLANGFYFLDIRTNKGNTMIKLSVVRR